MGAAGAGAGKVISYRGYGQGATVLKLDQTTGITDGMNLTIGAGTYEVTGLTGTTVTLGTALGAGVTILDGANPVHLGYADGATDIAVASAANLAVNDLVVINAQTYTVAAINANVVTLTTGITGGAITTPNLTTTDALVVGDFNVVNGSFGDGTVSLSADRKTVTITYATTGTATKDITTVGPNFNTILDVNNTPFGTTSVTVK